jgi:hypothetical protein
MMEDLNTKGTPDLSAHRYFNLLSKCKPAYAQITLIYLEYSLH